MVNLPSGLRAYDQETLTVTTPGISTLTAALLNNTAALTGDVPQHQQPPSYRKAQFVRISVTGPAATDGIRFTVDGTAPSATVGERILSGDAVRHRNLSYELAQQLQMIRVGAADATVEVTYLH